MRPFGCACVRRHWHLATDPPARALVEVAERHADGLADTEELEAAELGAHAVRRARSGLVVVGNGVCVPP